MAAINLEDIASERAETAFAQNYHASPDSVPPIPHGDDATKSLPVGPHLVPISEDPEDIMSSTLRLEDLSDEEFLSGDYFKDTGLITDHAHEDHSGVVETPLKQTYVIGWDILSGDFYFTPFDLETRTPDMLMDAAARRELEKRVKANPDVVVSSFMRAIGITKDTSAERVDRCASDAYHGLIGEEAELLVNLPWDIGDKVFVKGSIGRRTNYLETVFQHLMARKVGIEHQQTFDLYLPGIIEVDGERYSPAVRAMVMDRKPGVDLAKHLDITSRFGSSRPSSRSSSRPESGSGSRPSASSEGTPVHQDITADSGSVEGLSRVDKYDILSQLAEQISQAHAWGIVHRDIKKANAILTKIDNDASATEGIQRRHVRRYSATLIDWGIARWEHVPYETKGLVSGTPNYMPHEQLDPVRIAREGPRRESDIYAFTCLAYELLTGKNPNIYALDYLRKQEGKEGTPSTKDVLFDLPRAQKMGVAVEHPPKEVRDAYENMPEDVRELLEDGLSFDISARPEAFEFARIFHRTAQAYAVLDPAYAVQCDPEVFESPTRVLSK